MQDTPSLHDLHGDANVTSRPLPNESPEGIHSIGYSSPALQRIAAIWPSLPDDARNAIARLAQRGYERASGRHEGRNVAAIDVSRRPRQSTRD